MADIDDLRRAQALARELAGGRYIWGGCSRQGSDCSGFMSILLNSVQGRPQVFVRRFATGSIRTAADHLGLQPSLGDANDFNLGVRFPFESHSGIGHVAGSLGRLNVESRGGRGVLVGAAARGATNTLFTHHFHVPIDGAKLGAPPPPQPSRLLHPYPGHQHRRSPSVHDHTSLIQQRLNQIAGPRGHQSLGGKPLRADGEFGELTERVVRVFQRHRNLEVDGVVGTQTWGRMFRR
jgi:peptidoglycan hydrolase-like protein with peptidoglycan-binding domain